MYLLIDVGNTRLKWILIKDEFHDHLVFTTGSFGDFLDYIRSIDRANVCVNLAAVNLSIQLVETLDQAGFNKITIAKSKAEQLGVVNSYSQPERMGVDRWLAMIAAYTNMGDTANCNGVIVIDAGSALTIDVVGQDGLHQGGLIVPGLSMARRALFSNTERVIHYQEESVKNTTDLIVNKLGKNTVECVEYGVVNQLCALIQLTVQRYSNYKVILTGGDAESLATGLNLCGVNKIAIDKNLVLKGLWQVRN